MVQPQTKPLLGLTADRLGVPALVFLLSAACWGCGQGRWDVAAQSAQAQKEERVHFGLDLVRGAAVSSVSFVLIREPQDGMW